MYPPQVENDSDFIGGEGPQLLTPPTRVGIEKAERNSLSYIQRTSYRSLCLSLPHGLNIFSDSRRNQQIWMSLCSFPDGGAFGEFYMPILVPPPPLSLQN